MADINVEAAVDLAQQREDAVRDAIAALDEDITNMREAYSLPLDASQWTSVFASRITMRNKEHRQRVKQELYSIGHHLKHLYGEGGEEDSKNKSKAMSYLFGLVITAFKANRRMNAFLDELIALHGRLADAGTLSLADRVFIRKSLPDLERCRTRLASDVDKVKKDFDDYKHPLFIVAYESELKKCQDTLSKRKTTKHNVEQEARPLLSILAALSEARISIHQQSTILGYRQEMAWFQIPSGRVLTSEVEEELAKYDALSHSIAVQTDAHKEALRLLRALEESAVVAPATLPGRGRNEIPVEALCGTLAAYERICTSCTEMMQLLEPIVETLDHYLKVLRQVDVVRRAFSG
ncbi:hypothetical protein TRAPUB_1066 [Trametes pubescens]|uniref:Uncharacterized protein n=1 Tax=Trametes pubescens TaxID=154538 RepID=A0A1M2VKE4_TRAPU|nr:hypothetical protein TRAPUB_1066 [Trametes pubescens]